MINEKALFYIALNYIQAIRLKRGWNLIKEYSKKVANTLKTGLVILAIAGVLYLIKVILIN